MTTIPLRFQDAMDRAIIRTVADIETYMEFGWSFQTALNRAEMDSCFAIRSWDKVFQIMGLV